MDRIEAKILKQIDGDTAYYTLKWSPLVKADKYQITTCVPALSGVYELYRMDEEKRLNLLSVTHAWYGGLRSNIREAIDPYAKSDPERRKMLEDSELYYRYSCSDVFGDLLDVVWFLHTTYFPNEVNVSDSERYNEIYLIEETLDTLSWFEG